MYRMLDVANQVDWVSPRTFDLSLLGPLRPDRWTVKYFSFSVLPSPECEGGSDWSGNLERQRQDPGGEESDGDAQQLPGVENPRATPPSPPRQRPAHHVRPQETQKVYGPGPGPGP